MAEHRWYSSGLAFACQGCGNCCKSHGEYEYVYLSSADIDAISAYLGIEPFELLDRYCAGEEGWTFLRNLGPECVFLNGGRCTIYPVRPKQCEAWPFWRENLGQEIWHGPVAACCPGVGKGLVFSAEQIDRIAAERDRWYRT